MLQCFVRLSVVSLLSVTLCIVGKRCVLEQRLLLTAYRKSYNYEKSIGTEMNDLDFVQRSYQGHVNHCVQLTLNISETVIDKGLVPKDRQ